MFFRSASFATFHSTVNMLSLLSPSSKLESIEVSIEKLFAAGAFTGFVISFIETPIDLVKTKLQIQIFQSSAWHASAKSSSPINSVYGCAQHIVKHHGMKGLWQGWAATALRNIPANALFFPVNEIVKRSLAAQQGISTTDLPTR